MGLLLFLPFLLTFLQSEAYGYLPSMTVAIVSEELASFEGENICSSSRSHFSTEDFNCTVASPFTCLLIQSLQKSISPVIYYDEEAARTAVVTNRAWGMLHIPSNFTATFTRLVLYGGGVLEDRATLDELLDAVSINATLDASNFVVNQWLHKLIADRYQDFVNNLVTSCGLSENYGSTLRIMKPIYGDRNPKLSQSILPAFMSAWCFYFTLLFTSGAIMMEQSIGLIQRSMIAGTTYLELVTAHTVVQTALITVQKTIMLVVVYVCYEETLLGSLTLIVILLYAIEAVGVAYGFFITEITNSQRVITYNALFALNTALLVGGALWPLEGAHVVVRKIMSAFPVSLAVEAYRTIAFRGHGLENHVVIKGFLSCAVWVAIFTIGTMIAHRAKR